MKSAQSFFCLLVSFSYFTKQVVSPMQRNQINWNDWDEPKQSLKWNPLPSFQDLLFQVTTWGTWWWLRPVWSGCLRPTWAECCWACCVQGWAKAATETSQAMSDWKTLNMVSYHELLLLLNVQHLGIQMVVSAAHLNGLCVVCPFSRCGMCSYGFLCWRSVTSFFRQNRWGFKFRYPTGEQPDL